MGVVYSGAIQCLGWVERAGRVRAAVKYGLDSTALVTWETIGSMIGSRSRPNDGTYSCTSSELPVWCVD